MDGRATETLDRLREAFVRAEFTDDASATRASAPRGGDVDDAWRLRAAAPDGALSVLVRLWMVGAPVDRADAAEALAPATVEELEAAGLVDALADGRVRAAIVIKPYRDLLIAGDRLLVEPNEPADYVPGVNPVARCWRSRRSARRCGPRSTWGPATGRRCWRPPATRTTSWAQTSIRVRSRTPGSTRA